ncbi:MAG: hypothetical protein CVU18_09445 [Betaproteobacteria bacterium HGW-Betaproteobacteria-12]|nr:MAG: hypothetical protein CVU18_09445 [Betaproteobacteria bacterium HGW-Betaproteobacteria-12]
MSIAPDRFEVARDCRARYLQRLDLLLRSAGLLSEMACRAVVDGIGKHYDELVSRPSRGGFREEARGLTSSRITLVGDDELELGIRLDNLTGRLFEGAATDLWHTYLRFITLLARPELQKADNPVGPRGISEGLRAMFKAADAHTLDQQLDLVDRLEDLLLDGLPAIYREINDCLGQAGVAPAQASIVGSPEAPTKTAPPRPAETRDALVALQEDLLARTGDLAGGVTISGGDIGVALLSQAAIDNLLFRLDDLERTVSGQRDFLTSSSPDLSSLLPELFEDTRAKPAKPARPLNSRELGIPSATAEGLAIDSVAMLCDAILADPNLPDALKAMISSLQITLIKVAIKDHSLFTDPAHPCRQVIDRLGLALLGAPLDIPPQHPLCTQLTAVASTLRTAPSGGRAVFAEAAGRLDAIIAERSARIDSEAAAYLSLFARLEQRDQALVAIDGLFDRLAIDQEPPEIFHFLETAWRNLLEQIWLKEGPDSIAWQDHAGAAHTLLSSFQPGLDSEARKALASRLPHALKILTDGMERSNLPAAERTRLLDLFFSRQRDALRRNPVPATGEAVTPANRRPSQRVATGTLKYGNLTLHTLDFTQPHKLPPSPARCAPGDWLELTVAGQRQVLRLCRQSADSGRSLLFNPELPFALSIHPHLLAQQLGAGEASRLGVPGLFETAAMEALRESRR